MKQTTYLDLVDEQNHVIGHIAESDLYSGPNHHRIVHVMVSNERGEYVLQRRSPNDSFLPGAWVTSAGGHVHAGESAEFAAYREMMEELGIRSSLGLLGEFVYDVPTVPGMKKFLSIFETRHAGAFHLDHDEVAAIKFLTLSAIEERYRNGDSFHPELVAVLRNIYGLSLESRK